MSHRARAPPERRRRPACVWASVLLLALLMGAPSASAEGPATWVEEGVVLVYALRDVPDGEVVGTLRFEVTNVTDERVVVALSSRDMPERMGQVELVYTLWSDGFVLSASGTDGYAPAVSGENLGLWLDLETDFSDPFDFQGERVVFDGVGVANGILGVALLDEATSAVVAVHHAGDGLLLGFATLDGWASIDLAASVFPTPRFDPTSDRLVLGGIAAMCVVIVLATHVWLSRKREVAHVEWPAAWCHGCGRPRASVEAETCCRPLRAIGGEAS